MISLEQEMKNLLNKLKIKYEDNCGSKLDQDFWLYRNTDCFSVDVKEKLQAYQSHWTTKIPVKYLFIVDDVAVRRCLSGGIDSGIIIKDSTLNNYYFFSAVDFIMMPKERVNRKLHNGILRGKWLVDIRNGVKADSLPKILKILYKYWKANKEEFQVCYGAYVGERIPVRGGTRSLFHAKTDYKNSR
jgi:hypothetical protein